MPYSIVIEFDTLRSLAAGSVGAGYTAVGTPFSFPCRLLKIQNTTDAGVLLSTDGVNDQDYIPSGSFALYDITANQTSTSGGGFLTKGTQIYVKQSGVPTLGSIYVTTLYGRGD